MPAIPVHHTATSKEPWDGGVNQKRLREGEKPAYYQQAYAWEDPSGNDATKSAYKFPHHEVSESGDIGAASMKACQSGCGILNGGMGGAKIPESDRKAVFDHLAAHLKDGGEHVPEMKSKMDAEEAPQTAVFGLGATEELFLQSSQGTGGRVMPQTANATDRTIDVVWYGGATVPRVDAATGDPYMLQLDMQGCRMERMNAGAPVFDSHLDGSSFRSMMADKTGLRAQIGVVKKAWAEGDKGLATVQFKQPVDGNPDAPYLNQIWSDITSGIIRNLSFGTWIYTKQPTDANAGGTSNCFTATDWEPFEISPVTVPADFSTTFLSGIQAGETSPEQIEQLRGPVTEAVRASSPIQGEPAMSQQTSQQDTGTQARTDEAVLSAARQEAAKAERFRAAEINKMVKLAGLPESFAQKMTEDGIELEAVRVKIFEEMAVRGQQTTTGKPHPTVAEVTVTRDQRDTFRSQMEASVELRANPKASAEVQQLGREYAGLTLMEAARECLQFAGVNTRGMSRSEVARAALQGREHGAADYFAGSMTTSDLPNILANVANKSLREAYQASPKTFMPFCRQVTAADFKPVNRVQLSDVAALQKLNEKGEFQRVYVSDGKESYSLATWGGIVPITRKVIINDDLQSLTRIPAGLGVAAATLESDTVWGVVTNGATVLMADNVALFAAGHSNLVTSNGLTAVSAITKSRLNMRKQKGPKGTLLNLVPKYLIAPAALEGIAFQLVNPINLAATASSSDVPEFVRTMIPIIEPRLDAKASTGATDWYVVSDPNQIDTIEYCYLEGQQGVYLETRQGFDVDGIEVKARLDFAAAAIDFRGLQLNQA